MPQSKSRSKTQVRPDAEEQSKNFSKVFETFHQPIFNYLLRMTQHVGLAEDLLQETFVRVYRGLPNFRGGSSLSTWIYRIATNVSLDYFRSKRSRQDKVTDALEDIDADQEWITDSVTASSEQALVQAEMSACVRQYIRNLPPDYRAALVLSDLQGLKNKEIAEVLGVSLDTVKIRLHRARTKLRGALNIGCDFSHDERNVLVCEEKGENERAKEDV